MKPWTFSFRGLPLLVIFAFLLAARPGNAQTQDSGLAAEYARPGSAVILGHESDEGVKHFTNDQRLEWFVENTIGPRSLVAGVASTGVGAALSRPRGYGGSGQGFGPLYEMHLADTSTGNAMEATFGAIWREDPRYYRMPAEPFGRRVRSVIRMTFVAYRREGNLTPAYARYIGIAGSSFLANSWRPNREASLHDAALRTLAGFLGRMGSNAFQEFWPNVKRRLFH